MGVQILVRSNRIREQVAEHLPSAGSTALSVRRPIATSEAFDINLVPII